MNEGIGMSGGGGREEGCRRSAVRGNGGGGDSWADSSEALAVESPPLFL